MWTLPCRCAACRRFRAIAFRMLTWGLMQMNGFANTSRVEVHLSPMDKPQKILLNAARGPLIKLFDGDKPLVKVPFPRMDTSGLPVCTNFKIVVPMPPPMPSAPLATPSAPLATPVAPLATPAAPATPLVTPAAPLATLPKDRNARRKLPLPHDVKCGACGFIWKQGSITISQCETYRSQCKVHNRLCTQRVL